MNVIESIEYGSQRWDEIIQMLDIEFDAEIYRNHIESILDQVRESEDHDTKNEVIEKLENRLDILSNLV
jgi:hypothetical protein